MGKGLKGSYTLSWLVINGLKTGALALTGDVWHQKYETFKNNFKYSFYRLLKISLRHNTGWTILSLRLRYRAPDPALAKTRSSSLLSILQHFFLDSIELWKFFIFHHFLVINQLDRLSDLKTTLKITEIRRHFKLIFGTIWTYNKRRACVPYRIENCKPNMIWLYL